jgi:hypothetical protein
MSCMKARQQFWRWVFVFAALGLVVPALLLFWWHISPYGAGREAVLWPSSIMFMALDAGPTPEPRSTAFAVYAAALLENLALYAAIGAILWPVAQCTARLRNRHRRPTE